MSKVIDMIGKKFGHLTVIKRDKDHISPNGNKIVMWKCECDCNDKNIVTVDGKSLRAGKRVSCGCSRRINLIGKTFGKLTVLKKADDYISPKGEHKICWECKCSCGNNNIIYVVTHDLLSGHTKSCGCTHKEQLSKMSKKYNTYDLSNDYGKGYTLKNEEFLFDLEDYDKIKDYCWRFDNNGYLKTSYDNTIILFSRLVMNCPENLEVDHIYHKLYDNRKSQLRLANRNQQGFNRGIPKNNTSGVVGVSWREDINKWQTQLTEYGIHHYELFDNFDDAVSKRKEFEEKYFKNFKYIGDEKNE